MKEVSLSRQAKAKLDSNIRHRINAGRVAVQGQISFLKGILLRSVVIGSKMHPESPSPTWRFQRISS